MLVRGQPLQNLGCARHLTSISNNIEDAVDTANCLSFYRRFLVNPLWGGICWLFVPVRQGFIYFLAPYSV